MEGVVETLWMGQCDLKVTHKHFTHKKKCNNSIYFAQLRHNHQKPDLVIYFYTFAHWKNTNPEKLIQKKLLIQTKNIQSLN